MAFPLLSLAVRAGIPAARSGLRFLSRMKKPKGITVYRGEPKATDSIKDVAKWMYAGQDKYRNPLRQSAAGRWFTREPKFASRFAGYTGPLGSFPGHIKKVTLSPKEIRLAKKLSRKIHEGSGRKGSRVSMVIPKQALARVETDQLQTLINHFYKTLGIYRGKHGGLARILEV